MTLDQALAFGILGATVALFLWGRLPYDLVAMLALLAGLLAGIVPMQKAFTGFSDDIVVIVTAALVVSAAVARSGAVETAMRPLLPHLRSRRTQVPVLVAAVMLASVFTKNIGALAIFLPVALQLARRTGTPPGVLLMPMAFASLLGGLVTMIGTSPNIIVSRVREQVTGQPFGMFDYTPVGAAVALAGLLFLGFGWRLLAAGRRGKSAPQGAIAIEAYMTEARIAPDSPLAGATVGALQALCEDRVTVATLLREGLRRDAPPDDWALREGDLLILEGEPEDLESLLARARLTLVGEKSTAEDVPEDEKTVVEGVITAESPLAGATPSGAALAARFGISLLAVSRRGKRIRERLKELRLRRGDVVILKGEASRLPDTLAALRILPLTERGIPLGRSRRSWLPAIVLGLAMAAVALHLAPVGVVFFAAAVAMLLLRTLTPQEAYQAVDWPVVILLGALIPVSEAIHTTGGTELIAGWLSGAMDHLPPLGALGLIMVVAMAVTPFLNNAATVLMLGPIAGSLAQRLDLSPDAFLMAVAVGAACDFLTPIGHQCNTLVMGPGGYRFGDYWRLGLPLSAIVLAVGVPMIALVWPLAK
ncbi:SLC13 family permease [Siccirubricoccus sp. KC 17139]|uniref:SLC13 family permease n=1 Tax=Siccirubricoccus soli TaxID=2899147 RepID=A0ABT1D7R8_9PROT|nr:SLC13 family permease [Siccirubricoccus soli]MCO6417988.1 SLC13 family permease [Siccirubricoccus soli]MCP2684123.1 SLC13 family permease [Siccirubricoccus soli]